MTLRTPVIEMGVSNGAAVRADDLCEPIPGCTSPLSLHPFLPRFVSFLLPTALLSFRLSLFFRPATERGKGGKSNRGGVLRGSNIGLI